MYSYPHPRPAVTVDIAIFMPLDAGYQVLLVQRTAAPFQDCFALPGGFMEIDESLEEAARRELAEETNLKDISLTQIHTFSAPGRDPRGRVISTCFAGKLADADKQTLQAASDAKSLAWFDVQDLPELAFDHERMIKTALKEFLSV